METDRRYMTRSEAAVAQYDVGLRQYMLSVYNYMASAVALTGLVAYALGASALANPAVQNLLYSPNSIVFWVVAFAPLAFVFFISARIHAMSTGAAQAAFWVFAVLMGLSLGSIFLRYTGVSIARVFFITAGTFAAMSLYGYTTKRDLSGFGGFLVMGVIGIVIASIVNMFIASSALQFAISVIGVLVFTGMTAYKTQQIKELYDEVDASEVMGKKAILGALDLYITFINLFVVLLQLFGSNRE